jgi:hypothetical protein
VLAVIAFFALAAAGFTSDTGSYEYDY